MRERVTIALAAAALAGCVGSAEPPENPCPAPPAEDWVHVNHVDKVDLLFMVDNSNSMSEEQASLAAELESMVRILTSGDFDQDGERDGPDDFDPVKDLNVGVITSDMGVGGHAVPTCDRADFGDDGVLRTWGRTDIPGCMATYPSFLRYVPEVEISSPAQFAHDVACVATVGTGGCGFEQQLEAILKALSPSAPTAWTALEFTPPMFHEDTFGHADRENAGFVRESSVLAIIPVTDEEDCSASDPSLFDPASPTFGATDLNLRCWAHGDEALHPIERYVDGLLGLRVRPNQLIYAPIVGVPTDLAQYTDPATGNTAPIDWDRLVGPTDGTRDERMVERLDPTMENRLMPSCNVPGRGIAFPPVRMVEVARALDARGAGVTVQSICQESFTPALREIIRQIASGLSSDCVPRELPRREDGGLDCELLVVMPEGRTCAELPGAELLDDPEPSGPDRALCRLPQLIADGAVPEGDGWYYDDFSVGAESGCGGARVQTTMTLPLGADVGTRCFSTPGATTFGEECDPGAPPYDAGVATECEGTWIDGRSSLSCDPVWHTCGIPCDPYGSFIPSQCPTGLICDDRPLNELNPAIGSAAPHGFCVDPTCA